MNRTLVKEYEPVDSFLESHDRTLGFDGDMVIPGWLLMELGLT